MSTHELEFAVLKAHFDTHYATKPEEVCAGCLRVAEYGPLRKCIVSGVRKSCDNCHFRGIKCCAILKESHSIVEFYIRRSCEVMCRKQGDNDDYHNVMKELKSTLRAANDLVRFYKGVTMEPFVEGGPRVVVGADDGVDLRNASRFFDEELPMGFPLCPVDLVDRKVDGGIIEE
ncbi:predicted protein [Histoplasma capsulatum G186AR]|uniref:Uncharacterized protein n=1 Tax=Ajellomyces capsulatus (strain G186AR / H82 / ATCC MYA-2454 / RMSCC 2432) TaxID=447093 RepID=C0NPT7_AJECG|nr:uncharacterized protein HCBG_05167 [Histoplasma capsulatum G186AR]EEH06947.1 predicted protein [Histoplasma capsulatum G186AR]